MEKTRAEAYTNVNGHIPGVDKIESMTFDAGKKVGAFATNLKNATSDYVTNSRVYVKENPIKGVAIAATAGVVVGGLLSVAMRHRKHE